MAWKRRGTDTVAQVETVATKGHPPTGEQSEILKAIQQKFQTLVIEAGAGTGKTTTLRMLADVMRGNGQYTAFNAALVAESKEKFTGTKVACNTTHSLAFREVGRKFAKRLNGPRVRSDIIAKRLGIDGGFEVSLGEGKTRWLAPGFLAGQVIQGIKRFCQSADAEVALNHFRYIDGIEMGDGHGSENNNLVRRHLLPYLQVAWDDLSDSDGEMLPFNHDCYVKVWQLNKPVIAADYILLDEAQDTAPVMLDVIRQQKAPVILVGDSAQQIYEWRGAVNAMTSFSSAKKLTLSQSFRFGQAIADVANLILDSLVETTPVRLKGFKEIDSVVVCDEGIDDPDAILCRTNASAILALLEALGNGKKPYLVGGGSDVVSFVEAAETLQNGRKTSHPELACFDSWAEVQAYAKEDEGEELRLMVKLIDSFGTETILEVLKGMPEEKDADLIVSTAHRSKGREWKRVRLAADFPTREKSADSDLKLLYVAVTRAQLVLDVSRCPFFTGEDGMDISQIAGTMKEAGIKVEKAPTPVKQQFVWAKHQNQWVAKGPLDKSGETVAVYRRDGSCQEKTLGKAVFEDDLVAMYEVR